MRTAVRSFVPVTTLVEALEPRQLLAATFTGTDSDGDQFTIKLTGSGSFTQTLSNVGTGFIDTLALAGTDTTSRLTITVKKLAAGDGRVFLNEVTGGTLRSFTAPKADLAEDGRITLQLVSRIEIGDMFFDSELILGGGDSDKTAIFARFVEGDNLISVGARVTDLSFSDVNGLIDLELDRGADRISSKDGLAIRLIIDTNPTFPVSVKSITAKTGLTLFSDDNLNEVGIPGDITSIRAGFINGETNFNTLGVIGSITTTGSAQSIGGTWQAGRIGKVETRGSVTDASFFLRTPDAAGVTINSFIAGAVSGSTFNVAGGGLLGLIKRLEVASWSGGSIFARGITNLLSKGDFRTDLFLQSGAGQPQTINTAVVRGQLVGTWTVAAPIKSITARGTGSGQSDTFILTKPNTPNLTLDVKTLTFTGTEAVNVTLDGGTFGTISAKGDLDAVIAARQQDANGRSIGAIKARILSMELTDETSGGVGTITARAMQDSLINAAWINTINITGGSGVLGEMREADIRLTGEDAGGFSLRKLTVAANISGDAGPLLSRIRTAKAIGSISARSMANTTVYAGNFSLEEGFPADLSQFASTGSTIGSITLTSPFSDGLTFSMANSFVVARTISKVTVNGRINTGNTGVPFGFGGQTISNVTLKNTLGATVKPLIPNTAQDFSPFASSDDFIFAIYA